MFNLSLEEQYVLAQKIFEGAEKDKDGYCACSRCGYRNLMHDGISLDDGYISCLECGFSVHGDDGFSLLLKWNNLNRSSFQLKIPYSKPFS